MPVQPWELLLGTDGDNLLSIAINGVSRPLSLVNEWIASPRIKSTESLLKGKLVINDGTPFYRARPTEKEAMIRRISGNTENESANLILRRLTSTMKVGLGSSALVETTEVSSDRSVITNSDFVYIRVNVWRAAVTLVKRTSSVNKDTFSRAGSIYRKSVLW